MIKKSIMEQQQQLIMDATWVIEPHQRPMGMGEIVCKGQSVPNKLVMAGGINPSLNANIMRRKKELTSPRMNPHASGGMTTQDNS